jgi:hypothetical protein
MSPAHHISGSRFSVGTYVSLRGACRVVSSRAGGGCSGWLVRPDQKRLVEFAPIVSDSRGRLILGDLRCATAHRGFPRSRAELRSKLSAYPLLLLVCAGHSSRHTHRCRAFGRYRACGCGPNVRWFWGRSSERIFRKAQATQMTSGPTNLTRWHNAGAYCSILSDQLIINRAQGGHRARTAFWALHERMS